MSAYSRNHDFFGTLGLLGYAVTVVAFAVVLLTLSGCKSQSLGWTFMPDMPIARRSRLRKSVRCVLLHRIRFLEATSLILS